MDKILETSFGRNSDLYFSDNKQRIADQDIGKLVAERCDNYKIYSKGGVLVHITQKEYKTLLNQK